MSARFATAALRTRVFCVRASWWACFALLSPFVLLSSSSEAEDIAPWRSALELERLWGGVLGCADAGNDDEAVTNALAGDSVPGGVQRDYLDCGTRALRAAASRMLVDTIEDSLRWGGLYAFDREFRLESNLAWEFGGDLRGELDTILPIGGELHSDGTGRALFLQQGITFWEGRNNELRSDSNTGLVYRGHVSRDWILGGSFFFDYNFQRGHSRLSVGVDAQSKNFYGGLNYYFTPSGREWRRGRPGYEERVLEGWDLRWSFTWEQLRLSGAFGTWVFDGEGPGRRQSVSVSAGYRVYPGVFLEAGYEYHDDRSVDEDWNVGLAFRYSLPEMDGIGGGIGGGRVPDLWRIVDRERRILYEERLARPRVSATLAATPDRVEEGGSVTVQVVLGEALEEDVFFSVAAASGGTAEADDYGPLPSRMMIPAGALSTEETFGIVDDGRSEPDEILNLELKVLQESFFLVSRGNPHHARIVIGASDNTIVGFATESTSVTEGIGVDIPLKLGEPAPSGGFVLVTSSDEEEEVTMEASMEIVEGAQYGQYVRVLVNDDGYAENIEMVRIILDEPPGGLPEGWWIDRREHMLMIEPHDLNIAFDSPSSEASEDAGTVNLDLVLNERAPAGMVLALGSSSPVDAAPVNPVLQVPAGAKRVTFPVRITSDNIGEGSETVIISITESSPPMPEGWSIGSPDTHELTLVDDDIFVGFKHSSSQVYENDRSTDIEITLSEIGAPDGGMNLTVTAEGNDDNDISFATLVPVSAGEKEKTLRVTIAQDNLPEGAESIVLTLSGALPESWNYGQKTHELTILPNNQAAMFAEAGRTVGEGDGTVKFKVTLSEDAPAGGVPLEVAITSGNDDGDVTFTTQRFRIAQGGREHEISVVINDDNQAEQEEVVRFTLSKDASAAFPDAWGDLGTQTTFDLAITDDDGAIIGFTTSSTTLLESDTNGAVLTIRLNGSVSQNVEVTLSESGDGNEDITSSPVAPATLTFAPGETEKQVALAVNSANGDALPEGDVEITYTLTGTLPDNVNFATRRHVVTLVDDDKTIRFKDSSSIAKEGTTGHPVVVVLNFDPPSAGLAVAGVATGGHKGDVSIPSPILNFTGGTRELSMPVDVLEDNVREDAEIVQLELEETAAPLPAGWTLLASGDNDHDLTILPSDQAAMFAEAGRTVNEGDGTVTFKVTLSEDAPAGGVPLEVAIISGNEDGDVTFTTQRFRIAYGAREHEINVVINDDNQVEQEEVVRFTLSKDASATFPDAWGDLGTQTTFDLAITDDDSATIGFTTALSTLSEGDSTASLTVLLSAEVSQEVVVGLTESGDGNNDLEFAPTSLTFAPGETSHEVTLTVNASNNDSTVEGDVEITYTLTGSLPDDVTLGTREHVVTFMDDDSATVGFASSSSTLSEGDSTANLTVELSAEVSQDVVVMLTESGDGNDDLEFAPTSLTFAPGETSHEVTLTVNASNNDNQVEEDVEITYTLTGTLPDDVSFAGDRHVVTFTDDDSSTIGFVSRSSTLREGDGTATLRVMLTNPVSEDVVVALSESGDANNDVDFTPTSLTFASGQTSKEITLTVEDDNRVDPGATITYTLAGTLPDDVTLGTREHVVTFIDNDSSTIGFASGSSTLREGDGTATLRVVLTNPVSEDVVVALSESGDTNNEVAFSPSSVTFASGETSKEITLTVEDDNRVEPGATITYTLTGTLPDDVTLGTREHVVTFIDDDSSTVGFASGSSTLREDDGTATLIVMLSNPVLEDVVVALSESGDTNDEVAFSPSSVTFASGEMSKEITLTVVDDNRVEPGATITYTLTGTLPDDVTLGTREHVVTFIDDDSSIIGFTTASSTLSEDGSTASLTVLLSAEVSQEVVVGLTESGDGNNDLEFAPTSLTFAPGETDKQITLTVNNANNDNKVEEDVDITYTLTGTFSGNVSLDASRNTHVVTFMDDDSSTVGFASGSSTLREDDGTATLHVVLTNPVSEDVVVALSESGDTNDEVVFAPGSLTFASGETSQEITLTVVDDNRVEPGATITYTLTGSLPDDVTLGTRDHVVTFTDDDSATVGFVSLSSTLSEGDGTATLRVTLSNPVSEDVVVALSESGDINNEVSFAPGSVIFASGETSQEITLTVEDDNRVEPGATITYTLTGSLPDDVTLGTRDHVVTFTDDDSATVGFVSSSSTLSEGDGTATLSVMLSNPVSEDVVVALSESGDTNNEVAFAPGSVTFASGETSQEITLTVMDDNRVEPGATITYTLTGSLPDDVTLGTREHVVTFTDDDSATVGFTSSSSTLSEGDGTATLSVVLSNPVSEDVVVALSESGDTNNEVSFAPGSLTFASGETIQEITLTVVDDNRVEPGATITYTLTGSLPDDVTLGTREHVVTFIDDDSSTIGFTTALSTLSEGETSPASLTVSLSAAVSQSVEVVLTESGDSNNDLEFTPASLTFAPGETSHDVTLTVNSTNNDNYVEEDVEITYTLTGTFSGNVGLDAGRSTHVVTFTDDDSATVGFTSSSSTLSEGDSTANLTVELSAEVSQDVVVTLSESGDGNNDLEFMPASLTFAPGETSHDITLTVNPANNDNQVEEDVEITYTLTGTFSGNVSLDAGRSTHVVTFMDDDSATVGFVSSSSTLSEGDGTATLSVMLSNPVSEDVVLALSESGDTNNEVAFAPGSMTFASGETSQEITLTVEDDNRVEPGATITYTLTGSLPDDVTLGTGEHVVTLIDDDSSTIGFTTALSTLSEGDSTANLTVELSNEVSQDVVVTLSESGDGNNDLEFTPASLTFAPGETSHDVTLTVNPANNDNYVEEDVEITYTLTGTFSGNVSLDGGRSTHVVTFMDDDSATVGFVSSSSTLSEGDGTATLSVMLSNPVSEDVVLALSESGDTNNEVAFAPGSLTFASGEKSQEITLTVVDDNRVEPGATITYTLTGTFPDDVTLGTREHVVTFTDNDSATVGFASSSSILSEGDSTANLTVELSNEVSQDVVVTLSESGDGNNDLEFTPASLTFSPGETSHDVTLRVNASNNDNHVEEDVEIAYTLAGAFSGNVSLDAGRSTHLVTFMDDDSATVGFASSSSTLSEGDGTAILSVMLSNPVSEDVVLALSESGDTNNEVAFAPGSVTFVSGETSKEITLTVVDDNRVEPGATITYTLAGTLPGNLDVSFGARDHMVTFIDDDSSTVGFASSSSTLSEGENFANLTVELSAAVSQDVVVTLSESGDGNNDLEFAPTSLTFAPGDTSHNVTLTVNETSKDTNPEEDVKITYTIAGTFPDRVSLGTREHVVTFADDDKTIRFMKPSSSASEDTDGHPVAVVLNFDPPSGGLKVAAAANGPHASDVSIPSPVLNFTGSTRELSVLVDVLKDEQQEGAEVVYLELEETETPLLASWTLLASGDNDHDLTILPSNQTAMFAEAGKTVSEGDGTATFKVSLSEDAPAGGVPLQVAITSGNDDGDVTFTTQNFTIIEGENEHPLTVDINDDVLVEPSETITFTLSKGASATFPDAWGGLGTQTTFDLAITDDDSATIGFTTTSSTLLESDTTGAILTVRLNGSVPQNVEVTLSKSGDGNGDISSPVTPATLTFAPGETEKQVTLMANADNDDAIPEGDVEITYTLAGSLPDGVNFATRQHVVTFVDDDKTIRFKDSSSSAAEGTNGHPVAVVLNFDPPSVGLNVMAVAMGDHKDDVSIPSPVLNFTGNTRELPVLVDVLADGDQEDAEVVLLELESSGGSLPKGWTLIASGDDDHDLTILSSGQTAMFAESGRTVDEGDGTIPFRVTLSADAPTGGVPLQVEITSGNDSNDVIFTTQNFTITEGNREHTLMVGINDDNQVEPNEVVTFTLSEDTDFPKSWGGLGSQTTFDLTIRNDDSAIVGFATTSSTLLEDDTTGATLVVRLTGSVSQDVVVTLGESGDSNDDIDFSPSSLTFAPGDTEKQVTLRVNAANNDSTPEADFDIIYRLEGTLLGGVNFDPQEHVVTFVDDDKEIRFVQSSSSAGEGTDGHPVAVVLNFGPPSAGLEVMAVAKGPHAGDVSIPSPVLNFTGSTRESVLVDVPADGVQEGAEVVRLELEETATRLPDGWTLLASDTDDHDLTILPSDQTAMFAEAGRMVNEDAGTVEFKVTLSAAAPAGGVPLEVDITSGNDGDVTFTRERFRIAQGDHEHMLTATVVDDLRVESSETIVFTLVKDASATFPDAWGDLGTPQTFELTIRDNDEANIGFTSEESVLLEGEERGGVLTVSLTGEVSQEVRVTLTESGDIKGDLTPSDSLESENKIDELVFKPGETSKDVFLKINDDDDDPEEDVRITYTLGGSLPGSVRFDRITEHVVLFADDDRTISFKELASNVAEGFTGHPVEIVLNFNPPSDGLDIMVVPRGAHAGEITIPEPVVSFASNTLEKNVLVNTIQDEVREGSQLVLLDLMEIMSKRLPPGWFVTFEDSHDHNLTILASDQDAMFAEPNLTVEEGAGTVEFKVRLSAGAPAAHSSTETGDSVPAGVPLKVEVASGNDDGDITFTTQEFTIAEGAREHTLTVVIDDDGLVEPDETVVFELSKGADFPKDWGDLGTPVSFRLTITDNDASLEFANAGSSVSEDIGVVVIPLTLTGTPPESGLPMRIEFEHLGSTSADDYAFDTNPFIIQPAEPGEGYEIVVAIADDRLTEGNETLRMTLHTGEGFPSSWSGVGSQATHELTILASDQTAMFAETSKTVNEGQVNVSFEVELSAGAPTGGVPLAVSIVSGNSDNDVSSFSPESFVIAPGIRSQTISVVMDDDELLEDTETIRFALAKDATGTFPDKWGGLGTQTTFDLVITDNDASIAFVEEESEVAEGIGTANIPLALTRPPPAAGLEMRIEFEHLGSTTADDYAFNTNPFVLLPANVTNVGAEWTYMLELPITDDPHVEDDEEMRLVLHTGGSFPSEWGRLGTRTTHKLTILSSDQTVQFAESGTTVDEDVGDVTFDVVMTTGAPADGLSLEVSSSDTEGEDVTFSPTAFKILEGGDRMTITASVTDDEIVEEEDTITFTLSKGAMFNNVWGDLGAQTTFDLTIRASDGSVAFASDESMAEEDAGAVMIALDVQGVPPTDGLPMRVEIAGHGRNAATATTDDYTFDPLAFTLMPAEAGEGYNLVFSITDDDLPENDETFAITLHAGEGFPTGWGGLGGQTTHYLTILPNDKTIGFADTLPAELEEGTSDFPLELVWNAEIRSSEKMHISVELEKGDGGGVDSDVLLEFPPRTFNEFQDSSHDYLFYRGPPGSDRRIEMNVRDDALAEEDEEIVVRLVPRRDSSLPEGWSIEPAEYRFIIPANDKYLGFAATDSSLVEPTGNPGAQVSRNVVVKLNGLAPVGGLNLMVSVNEETDDDGENIDAEVTTGEGGVVFIPEGAEEVLLPVTALDDDIPESDEPVVLTLSKGANWPEGWEIGGLTGTGNLGVTHTVTILGNDKKVGWQQAIRKLVSEANFASVSPVVTNYPAPAGGLHFTVEVIPHGGSYAPADVSTDPDSGDLFYREEVSVRENTRFQGANTVAPRDDGEAEPDEAAVFRLSVKNGEQLPPGWEWSNQDLEVVIFANDNDFTFTDQNGETEGSYSEGDTVRLTAVMDNLLPPPVSDDQSATFDRRVGRFGMEITEHSDDISIAPVAPVVYHSDYHNPDGSRKPGVVAPIDGGQERSAEYNFDVTEDGLRSVSFDVTINEDSETEPPENIVITLSMSGSWGKRSTTQHYTLTVNDEGGTGMVGFSQAEIDKGPYGLFEIASLGQQNPGVVVELSSPAPAGGIDLVLKSSHPNEFFVGGIVHVQQHIRRCYVKLSQLSGDGNGGNYHFPEHRERCYFVDFNVKPDGDPEPDETYEIIISEDSPLPPKWGIDSNRSRREVTIYSSDNKVGIAGFIDPADGELRKSVSLDEDEGPVRLVLDVPNDPGPGYPGLPSGLHLRLNVTPNTVGANAADLGGFTSRNFTIPRRNQEGSFQHVIDIPIEDDSDAEQLESFSFRLNFQSRGNAHNSWGNVDWENNTATLRIYDSDHGTLGFADRGPVEIAEGESEYLRLDFSVPTTADVSMLFEGEYSNGNPVPEDTDISFARRLDVITPGTTSYNLKVEALQDEYVETDETITISIVPVQPFPDSLELVNGTIDVLIPANNNKIEFTKDATEVVEGVGTVDVTLTLTNPAPSGGLPLRIPTLAGAASGSSFTFTEYGNEFIVMPEDELQYTFTVNIDDDNLVEDTENYDLVIEKGSNFPDGWGTLGEQVMHRLTIKPSDFGEVEFVDIAGQVIEGTDANVIETDSLELKISLDAPLPLDVPLRLEAVEHDGDSNEDISGFPRNYTIPAGTAGPVLISFSVVNDFVVERDEFVSIELKKGENFPHSLEIGGRNVFDAVILASDNNYCLMSCEDEDDDHEFSEGGEIRLRIGLSAPAPADGLPMYIAHTSTYAGSREDGHMSLDDYTAETVQIGAYPSTRFTIPPGATEYEVAFSTVDDDDVEEDEYGSFLLFEDDNFPSSWGTVRGFGTENIVIPANDFGGIGFTLSESDAIEDDEEDLGNNVEISLSKPLEEYVVFVNVTAEELDGDGAADIEILNNRLRFDPTVSTANLNFKVLNDGLKERAEEVVLRLSVEDVKRAGDPPKNLFSDFTLPRELLEITQETHTITIKDNDNKIEFEKLGTTVDEGDGTVPVKLVLSNPAPAGGLNLVLERGNTQAPFDFTLVGHDSGTGIRVGTGTVTRTNPNIHIEEGEEEYVLSVAVTDDNEAEAAESFDFTIRFAAGDNESWGRIGQKSTHRFTIRDSDFGTISFAQSSASLVEIEDLVPSVSNEMNLDIRLSRALPVDVKFKISGQGSDEDHEPDVMVDGFERFVPKERMIPAGQTTASFTIRAMLDGIAEPDELITYTIIVLEDTDAGILVPDSLEISPTPFELTILANENTVRFANLTSTAEEGGSIDVEFTLTNPAPDGDLAFTFQHLRIRGSSAPALAEAGLDYTGDIRTERVSGVDLHYTDVRIPAGKKSHKVVFDVVDDDVTEEVEGVRLTVIETRSIPKTWGVFGEVIPDRGVGTPAGRLFHDMTISRSDEGIVGFDMDDEQTTLVEGEEVDLKISLADGEGNPVSALPGPVNLEYAMFEKNGKASNDLKMVGGRSGTGRFTIPANHDPVQPFILRMQAIPDREIELDEIHEIRLSFGSNYPADWGLSSTKSTYDILIPANENIVHFAEAEVTLEEEEEDRTYMIEVVSFLEAPSGGLPLEVIKTSGGPGLEDSDYSFTRQSFTIQEGESSHRFPFTVRGDTAGEDDEEIRLELRKRAGFPDGVLGAANWGNLRRNANGTESMTITIPANDNTISFASAGPTMLQEETETTRTHLEILINDPVPQAFKLDIEVTDEDGGTLQELAFDLGGARYRTTLDVPANAPSIMLPVWAYNDSVPDAEKRATITISTSGTNADRTRGWTFVNNTHEVVLLANDNRVEFAESEKIVEEDEAGTFDIALNLTTPAPSGGLPLVFEPLMFNGIEAADYTLDTSPFVIPEGTTGSYNIPFTVIDDNLGEDAESVTMVLQQGAGFPTEWGVLSSTARQFEVTILPSDNGNVGFVHTRATIQKPVNTSFIHSIEITLDRPAPPSGLKFKIPQNDWQNNGDISVGVWEGEGLVWNSNEQSLRILPGEESAWLRVSIFDNNVVDYRDKFFRFHLDWFDESFASLNWEITEPIYDLTILSNDRTLGWRRRGSSTPLSPSDNLVFSEHAQSEIPFAIIASGAPSRADFDLLLEITDKQTGQVQIYPEGGSFTGDIQKSSEDEETRHPVQRQTAGGWNIDLKVADDEEIEPDEQFTLRLVPDTENRLLPPGWLWVTPNANEITVTVRTNDNNLNFTGSESTLTRTRGSTAEVSVTLTNPAPEDGLDLIITIEGEGGNFIQLVEHDSGTELDSAGDGISSFEFEVLPGATSASFDAKLIRNLAVDKDVTLKITTEDIDMISSEIAPRPGAQAGFYWGRLGEQTTHTLKMRDPDTATGDARGASLSPPAPFPLWR